MHLRITASLALAAACTAACASVTSGTGSVASSLPGPSTTSASSTPATSPSTVPSSGSSPGPSASGSAPTTTGACPASADFCDDFTSSGSGWPVGNEARYYSNYNRYLGGTYRMGERTANAKTQLAPFDVTTVSRDDGVRIDVAAVLGDTAPTSSYLGIVCWDHAAKNGNEAGFLFFVTRTSVDVTLLDDTDGSPHTIALTPGTGFVLPNPAVNRLSATCTQSRGSGGVRAVLELTVNGESALRTTYARSVTNHAWQPGGKAGLLVAGKNSDVFYDNFAITGT